MPIYEYRCKACGAKRERLEPRIDQMAPPRCASCGGATRKLMSAGIFDLRGGGFRQNEYGSGAEKLGLKDQRRRLLRESAKDPSRTLPPELQTTFETEIQTSDRDMGMWLERRDVSIAERKEAKKAKKKAKDGA